MFGESWPVLQASQSDQCNSRMSYKEKWHGNQKSKQASKQANQTFHDSIQPFTHIPQKTSESRATPFGKLRFDMSDSNPSFVLYGPGNARIEDLPGPQLTDPGDVILRVQFVGVCGSDVHFWTNGGIGKAMVSEQHGITMGHEGSATVHAVGSAVKSLQPGDKVAIEPGEACRKCVRCKEGLYNLCPHMKFAACPPDTPGLLSRYFRISADHCYKLPEHVSLEEGVMVEPLAVAAKAVRSVDIRPGQTVIVFGAGTVGLLSAAIARVYGAKTVVSVDILDSKLEFAKKFNNSQTFKPDMKASPEENARRLVEENELGLGADAVIEASGAASSVSTAVHALRPGGQYVQTGLGQPYQNFPILAMSTKELHMHGAFRYTKADYDIAMDMLERGLVRVNDLISKIFPFEQTTSAWDATKRGEGIKNLIRGVGD
jgi:D-xylulose reductase